MMRSKEGRSVHKKGIVNAVSARTGKCPLGLAFERARGAETRL